MPQLVAPECKPEPIRQAWHPQSKCYHLQGGILDAIGTGKLDLASLTLASGAETALMENAASGTFVVIAWHPRNRSSQRH